MRMHVSIQDFREAIAKNQGAMELADPAFFRDVEKRYAALKSNSSHPGDFRRLDHDVRSWASNYAKKADWKAERDRPAYDGALAWMDLINSEIETLVIARDALPGAFPGESGPSGWRNADTGQPIKVYSPGEAIYSGRPQSVGIGDLIEGMFFGPRNEKIRNALTEGTDTAGGYTVPLEISREFIDRLRAKSVFIQAGARTLPLDGKTRIVRLESDPTAAWHAENASVGDSDIVLSAIDFTPKSLSTLVRVSYELLQDSINVGDILTRALVSALSTELDRAALFGAGTATEPLGLFNTPNINSVSMGANGATPSSFDQLVDSLYEIELDNADAPTACIWHPRTAKTYRKLKDSTNQPLIAPDPIKNMPKLSTTAVPITQTQGTSTDCSTVLMGNFAKAILGLREQITIIRLDQTFAANGQVAFWARMRADFGFAHGQSFNKLLGVRP